MIRRSGAALGILLALAAPVARGQATAVPPEPRLEHAGYAAASGDKTGAARILEDYLRAHPGDADALRFLGQVRLALLQPERAAVVYRALLEARPDSLDAIGGLGHSLLLSGRFAETAVAYRDFLGRNPGQPQVSRALDQLEGERQTIAGLHRVNNRLGVLSGAVAAVWLVLFVGASRVVRRG